MSSPAHARTGDPENPTPLLDDPGAMRRFLVEHQVFSPDTPITITPLTGGVSSLVVRAESDGLRVIVKQALPQLKVRDEWLSRVERSLIEAQCARILLELVPHSVPALIAVDEDRHAFVMECAPTGSVTWKSALMEGTVSLQTASAAGRLLANIQVRSARRPALREAFSDRSFFQELRVDPYLGTIALRHSDLAPVINATIEEVLGTQCCLVHGDYSPKNVLVLPTGQILLLDHEVAHWGNPSFDVAFALSHLCLKALKFPDRAHLYLAAVQAFSDAYDQIGQSSTDLTWPQAIRLLGCLLLARVDGKSPVEYLVSEQEQSRVRSLARDLIGERVSEKDAVLERISRVAARA